MRDPILLTQLGFTAAAIGIVVAVTLHKTVRHPRFPIVALLLSRGVLPLFVGAAWAIGAYSDFAVVWVGRISTLLLLLALVAAAVQAPHLNVTRIREGRDLWLSAMAFTLTAMLSDVVNVEAEVRTLLPVAGFTATWLTLTHPRWLLTLAKWVLALYVVGSAAAALLAPFAWLPYDASLIGMETRLQGLASHPNTLGPLMALYLILEYMQPSRWWVRWAVGSTALTLLVLAQSKTGWAVAAVAGVILWAGRSPRSPSVRLLLAAMIGTTAFVMVFVTDDAAEYEIVERDELESLRTLTGRTTVWAYGLDAWRQEPVFGGGRLLFQEYAERTGQDWAGQAHNQYVQTLGRRGLVGLLGLLAYVAIIVRYGIRHRHATRYGSLALVALVLLRSLTESNLDSFTLEQLVVFSLLLAWERAPAADLGDDHEHARSLGAP